MTFQTLRYTLLTLITMMAMMIFASTSHARPTWAPSIKRVIEPNNIIKQDLGTELATWYGPGYYGNRTACGSTLKTNTWGIAHRTLPCGQMVWIKYRGKAVIVPVMDRGPFGAATVDLTGRTSTYLKFSGAGNIQMKVLNMRLKNSAL